MPGDTEIEIKIPLDEKTFSKVREKLRELAEFRKKIRQVDDYYTPPHRNFLEPEIPYEWLRIGKRGDRTILSYKHWYLDKEAGTGTHCDEINIEVREPEQIRKLFTALNFKKLVTVDKQREIYSNDGFEIVLDFVKDLGHFIEIESKKDFGGVEETRKKLFEFAKNLGIDSSNPDKLGYPFSLLKKKGLIK
ncbi:MAG: class IV adenylate cyclase [archaeon]|nr:MAG: class IV adenylate cyclase [archaeon]